MKSFFIETDQLTVAIRMLRYVYNETDEGAISLVKVVDPATLEEISVEDLKKISNPTSLLNMATAYMATYKRTYF
jgi:hypothetical protein